MNIKKEIKEKLSKYDPQNASEMIDAAVINAVKAGEPTAVQIPVEYERIDAELWDSGEYFVFKVRGNSMLPRFCDCDRVIAKKESEYRSGDIVLAYVDGGLTLKELKRTPAGIELIPLNWDYDVQKYKMNAFEHKNVQIIGRVFELRGKV